MNKILTKYDYRSKVEPHPGHAEWLCQECDHGTTFLTVALFHQHDEHGIPMHELEVRTAFIRRKETL